MQDDQHDDQRKLIEQLQSTVNDLSDRLDKLSARLDTHLQCENEPTPPQPKPLQPTPPKPTASSSSSYQIPKDTTRKPAKKPFVKPISKPTPKPKRPPFDPSKFEWLLGIKGLMLVGVIIIVVGVAMFLKLAADEGWIAAISPAMRCLSTATFGFALVMLGEFLRKKINPLASSGFTAAGIATIYASILASTKMFDLIDIPLAFILLFLVTVLGIYLGSLSNRVMLSILSLIGAFAVPILLSTGEGSRVILPVYLLSLLTIGLSLSGWKGGRYAYVRQLAWWGTGLVGTAWIHRMYIDAPINTLAFVASAWTMTVIELTVSARFFKTLRDKHAWPQNSKSGFIRKENNEISFDPRTLLLPESRWINALFGATVWAAIAAGITLRGINPDYDFIAPLSLAIMSTLIVALSTFTKIKLTGKLCTDSTSPPALLGAALIINAAMLAVATIAVAFGGWLQVLAWIVAGLAATETARQIRFRAVGIFGLALFAVAITRLLTVDLENYFNATPSIEAFEVASTPWTLQMTLATLAFIAAFARSRYTPEKTIAICTAIWTASFAIVHEQTHLHALGPAWLIIAAIGCWSAPRIKNTPLRINAYILSAIAMCITLAAQLNLSNNLGYEIEIHTVSMIITTLAWIAIAASPTSDFVTRTISATLATISALIAIGKLDSTMGTSEMLFFQSIALATMIALGKRLYAWSLNEIATTYTLLLAVGWGLNELNLGAQAIQAPPFLRPDSLAVLAILLTLFWSAKTTTARNQASDSPAQLHRSRQSITTASFATLWLLFLAATSLEVVRSTRALFDAGSARGASISIWWSIYAIASVAAGFKLHKALRWAGLSLMGIVAAKVLLIDTMTLAPPARVVAAITVGLIIIATGVLYTRLVATTEDDQEPKQPTDDSTVTEESVDE
jgi:uncharacterized membrane protein